MNNDLYIIKPNTYISEMIEKFPKVGEMLALEWGFHCANCFASGFENIEQGAFAHGIIDEDFEMMLTMINSFIKSEYPNIV